MKDLFSSWVDWVKYCAVLTYFVLLHLFDLLTHLLSLFILIANIIHLLLVLYLVEEKKEEVVIYMSKVVFSWC